MRRTLLLLPCSETLASSGLAGAVVALKSAMADETGARARWPTLHAPGKNEDENNLTFPVKRLRQSVGRAVGSATPCLQNLLVSHCGDRRASKNDFFKSQAVTFS